MTDTVIESFRTTIGGFNKGDVTNYIAKTAAEFDKKLKEKEAENIELQQKIELLEHKLHELENNSGDHRQECAILQQNNEMLRQKFTMLQQENMMLQQENENLKAQTALLQEQLDSGRREEEETEAASDAADEPVSASVSAAAEPTLNELELAAYRRAESTERIAVERAKRINAEMETLFKNAAEEYGGADGKLSGVIDGLTAQLTAMQEIRSQLEQSRNSVQQQFGNVCGREFFLMIGEDS